MSPAAWQRLCPDELTNGHAGGSRAGRARQPRPTRPRYEPAYARFCSTFPDAFFVSERARVYLDPKKEKQNAGRLLSAGFHSMTGYFRDDAPLYELILDAKGQRELDGLWEEFDFITGAPMRQYASFLWFERTDSRFMRGAEFDFARAEDKDAAPRPRSSGLPKSISDKARKNNASETALAGDQGPFRDHLGEHPPGRSRAGWRRSRAISRPCRRSPSGLTAVRCRRPSATASPRFIARCATRTGSVTKTPCATRSSAC